MKGARRGRRKGLPGSGRWLGLLALVASLGCGGDGGTSAAPPVAPGVAAEGAPAGPPAEAPAAAAEPVADAWSRPPDTDATQAARERLVRESLEARGIADAAVLDAMRRVPRHAFVPPDVRAHAYEDRPLAIGWDQTISQPYVVASMTAEAGIDAGARVLEIGTGSGYQAAVLAEIAGEVYTIEIKERLCARARSVLRANGCENVNVRWADGYFGWPEAAPFDAIVVTAAAPHVPPPLVRQLAPGGRMVIPVGPPFAVQDLVLVTKDLEGEVRTRSLYAVRFVPLTGSLGERED